MRGAWTPFAHLLAVLYAAREGDRPLLAQSLVCTWSLVRVSQNRELRKLRFDANAH